MSLSNTAIIEFFPGEEILADLLQQNLVIKVSGKIIRQGRLIFFKRVHYVYQLTFIKPKGNRETLELPLPFTIETYPQEKLVYFDYRNKTLTHNNPELNMKLSRVKIIDPTVFYNKIVEIEYN